MHPFLYGTLITTLYIAVAVGIMFIARKLINIPDELFRKILHFILLGAYIPLCFAFDAWWMATVYALSLIVILFPALFLAQKIPMFSSFVNERKKRRVHKQYGICRRHDGIQHRSMLGLLR